jgi:hypothetical protein
MGWQTIATVWMTAPEDPAWDQLDRLAWAAVVPELNEQRQH